MMILVYLYITLSYSIIKDEQANLTNPFLMSSLYQAGGRLSRTFFRSRNFLDQWIKCHGVSSMLLMPSLYLTVFRMSRAFSWPMTFRHQLWWSHLSFCQRERASYPASFLMDSLYPGLNLTSRTFFELVEFFLDVRHARDLMRDSKGRTARSYFPTVHELIIAQPDQLVKKKISVVFFFLLAWIFPYQNVSELCPYFSLDFSHTA